LDPLEEEAREYDIQDQSLFANDLLCPEFCEPTLTANVIGKRLLGAIDERVDERLCEVGSVDLVGEFRAKRIELMVRISS
jgi:hypothetical protein